MPQRKNENRKRKKFLFSLLLVIFIIFFISINTRTEKESRTISTISKSIFPKRTEEEKTVAKKLKLAKHLENNKKYTESIEIFNEIVEILEQTSVFSNKYKSDIWGLKTNLHIRLWQHADAKISLDKALNFATPRQKKKLLRLTDWLENIVEKKNTERNLKVSYLGSPNVGPSAVLGGEIGIVHLFIEEKSGKSWGLKQRTISLTSMNKAKQWLRKESAKYNKSVSFKQRVYSVTRNPVIKRLAVGAYDSQNNNSNLIVVLAVKQLGEKNVQDFLHAQKQDMSTDEVILLVHVNKLGRSFAKRCVYRCGLLGEYTYILEEAKVKKWQSMEFVQAHESLHLFGADDLYNIKASKFYATRDIMNYYSRYLSANVIEPITAYGVGLINEEPKAPFKIYIEN